MPTRPIQRSFRWDYIETLEPRRLLSAATSGVVAYDPIAGTEYVLPADQVATVDADMAVLEQSLRSEGYNGLDDLLASLGTPRDFQTQLNDRLGIATGGNKADDGCGCSAHAPADEATQSGPRESVFGPDDRTQITGTTTFPWRTIGRINTGCSGAMIGPYHFLTAGHCVHSGGPGGAWFTDVQVSLAQNGSERFYGTANATWMRTYTAWTNSSDWSWDWALITLDRNIGNFTGWMGREWNGTTAHYNGTTVNTAGYPGDKPFGTMWYATGPIGTSTSTHFFYNGTMDTAGGQSGSPVWRFDGTNRYILGVHAYGDGGNGWNEAVRLTSGKNTDLNNWITEDNGVRAPTDRADLVDWDAWFNGTSAFMSH
ncbi:MAG TPA: trypsin-like serine protease, partial [Tepidisphaeraceae bacterium]|nr:trypsin-like serine protease [Tepidisphaeraceae bacterium]